MSRDIRIGDEVYLQPKTLGAPAVCYQQPKVTIVSISPLSCYVDVELPDGTRRGIHEDNLSRTPPGQGKPRKSTAPARKPLHLAEGEQEVPLWT